ncbi:MAG: sigma-70 family RNA polymerase sigma factor [Acidobacteriia bacterium]|nr:sigma-70 family RNA polymerase sigma factor [Terriglobia bacterium]
MAQELTTLLQRLESGDRDAIDDVMPLVYDELKKLAKAHLRREVGSVSLETTGLVHEAFLKLAGGRHPSYENRAHFYGIASRLMRQVLVDSARARAAEKRGPGLEVAIADLRDWVLQPNRSILALDEALRELERSDPRKAQLIEMRYFGGMTANETASALSESVHVVRRELRLAQAWLRREMSGETACPASAELSQAAMGYCGD